MLARLDLLFLLVRQALPVLPALLVLLVSFAAAAVIALKFVDRDKR